MNVLHKNKSKTLAAPQPQHYSLFEIMEGRKYHSAIMPSEGDPFQAFENVRREERNHRLSLVEVRNGTRTEVVAAELVQPAIEDREYEEYEEQSDEYGNL